jgi:fibronectin type 3 domain-containing protein
MARLERLLVAGISLCLACTIVPDFERLGRAFESTGPPEAPRLTESPPSKLAAPQGLHATSGELRAVPLGWDPVLTGGVKGYVVERALRSGGRFDRIAILPERFATTWVDRGSDLAPKASGSTSGDLGDGATYHYRVRAFNRLGRISERASDEAEATTAALPARPEALRTYSNWPGEIALSWSAVVDPTVASYVIYRSPSLRGDYLPIGRTAGRHSTTWVDRGIDPLRVFYYKISAVSEAGGEGLPTPAARGVTKPEPLPPLGLRVAELRLGTVRLAWEPNVEANIAGYRVLRRREGAQHEELVAVLEGGATTVEDSAVGAQELLQYRAIAFDTDGLESDPSDPVAATAIGYGLDGTARDGKIELHWNPEIHAGFSEARVLRLGRLGPRELARVPRPSFVDDDVKRKRRYRYVVVLVRKDGSEAPPSLPVEVEAR